MVELFVEVLVLLVYRLLLLKLNIGVRLVCFCVGRIFFMRLFSRIGFVSGVG